MPPAELYALENIVKNILKHLFMSVYIHTDIYKYVYICIYQRKQEVYMRYPISVTFHYFDIQISNIIDNILKVLSIFVCNIHYIIDVYNIIHIYIICPHQA